MTDTPGEHARVCELLGREPRGRYEVVVRDDAGDPVVLRNAPLLDDGTPMPTRYWLIGPAEIRRIGRLESDGGVDRAEADVDAAALADAHERYAAERDAEIPAGHDGPRPSGGVGGTRIGVKCLHAHWAWHLAGGDDPIGDWIANELDAHERPDITVDGPTLSLSQGGRDWTFPVGPDALLDRWLRDHDPPRPEALTNALGDVADHLDDAVRDQPAVAAGRTGAARGRGATTIARLEVGVDHPPLPLTLGRDVVEELFRLVATESLADRAHNPGLPSADVERVLADLCVVVATMRRLGLVEIVLTDGPDRG